MNTGRCLRLMCSFFPSFFFFWLLLAERSALPLPLNHPITHGGAPSHNELRGRREGVGVGGMWAGEGWVGGGVRVGGCSRKKTSAKTVQLPRLPLGGSNTLALLCLPSCGPPPPPPSHRHRWWSGVVRGGVGSGGAEVQQWWITIRACNNINKSFLSHPSLIPSAHVDRAAASAAQTTQ